MEELPADSNPMSSHFDAAVASQIAVAIKWLRRLTIALWATCAVLAASFIVPWVVYWLQPQPEGATALGHASSSSDLEERIAEFDNDFAERPLRQKVQRATVILLTERRSVGGRYRQVISEIPKHAPGVRFYYQAGDEFEHPAGRSSLDCGAQAECDDDGLVVFLTGNPATMRYSTTHADGRIGHFGDMPIDELRSMIAGQ